MVNVGIHYLISTVAFWGASIFHNFAVNNLDGIDDPKAYLEALPKYDRFLAKASETLVMGGTLVGAFLLTIGFLAIPVVGPFLLAAAAVAVFLDLLKVKRIKKGLKKAEENVDLS